MPRNIIIYASPFKDSFTARLLQEQVKELSGGAVTYDCFANTPAPCDGCGFCKTVNGCKHHDLDSFFSDFEAAEKVVFAFPIYNNSFPAPLKAVLDRFQRFYSARFCRNMCPPIKGNRKVTLIMSGGCNSDPLPIILQQINPIFTISGCSLEKAIVLTGTDQLSKNDQLHPQITKY